MNETKHFQIEGRHDLTEKTPDFLILVDFPIFSHFIDGILYLLLS